MHDTARLAMKSSAGAHVPPPSSVRQIPPPALAAHMRSGCAGSTTIARVRPPTLPGPSHTQPVLTTPAAGAGAPGPPGAAAALGVGAISARGLTVFSAGRP